MKVRIKLFALLEDYLRWALENGVDLEVATAPRDGRRQDSTCGRLASRPLTQLPGTANAAPAVPPTSAGHLAPIQAADPASMARNVIDKRWRSPKPSSSASSAGPGRPPHVIDGNRIHVARPAAPRHHWARRGAPHRGRHLPPPAWPGLHGYGGTRRPRRWRFERWFQRGAGRAFCMEESGSAANRRQTSALFASTGRSVSSIPGLHASLAAAITTRSPRCRAQLGPSAIFGVRSRPAPQTSCAPQPRPGCTSCRSSQWASNRSSPPRNPRSWHVYMPTSTRGSEAGGQASARGAWRPA
jgi:hypothetical protein